jgi:hypothetical protein
MIWEISNRADIELRALADRHYNRQSVGSPQFAPPGRAFVLKSRDRRAYWITSWPYAEYVRHEWAGAWVCSAFRNEGAIGPDGQLMLASEMIIDALACTLARWPEHPRVASVCGDIAMVTFVDSGKIRRTRTPGRCYIKAGFRPIGFTKSGLVALGLGVDRLPEARLATGAQIGLFDGT